MLVFGLIGKKAVEKGVPGHGALQDDKPLLQSSGACLHGAAAERPSRADPASVRKVLSGWGRQAVPQLQEEDWRPEKIWMNSYSLK